MVSPLMTSASRGRFTKESLPGSLLFPETIATTREAGRATIPPTDVRGSRRSCTRAEFSYTSLTKPTRPVGTMTGIYFLMPLSLVDDQRLCPSPVVAGDDRSPRQVVLFITLLERKESLQSDILRKDLAVLSLLRAKTFIFLTERI